RADGEGASALFFSGGVDSFHRLLRGRPVDWIVTLHGFDIPLSDTIRAGGAEASLRAVAAATGTKPVLVRANMREHPIARDSPWPRVHAGLMAGVGHALAPSVGRMIFSASPPGDWALHPWGSHVEIDAWWSSPRVRFAHEDAWHLRVDKT